MFRQDFFLFVLAETTIYKKVGDTVVLEPGEIQKPITSIEWRVGVDLAAHLEGGQVEYFRHFKGKLSRVQLKSLRVLSRS